MLRFFNEFLTEFIGNKFLFVVSIRFYIGFFWIMHPLLNSNMNWISTLSTIITTFFMLTYCRPFTLDTLTTLSFMLAYLISATINTCTTLSFMFTFFHICSLIFQTFIATFQCQSFFDFELWCMGSCLAHSAFLYSSMILNIL